MSLIDAINNVCDSIGIDRLDQIVGSGEENPQTMLELANQAGQEISSRVDWEKQISNAFISASPQTLPTDFHRVVPGGGILMSTGVFARPVTNSAQWNIILRGSAIPYYFVSGGKIAIFPFSGSASLDYVSKNWVIGTTGRDDEFNSDDNEMSFPQKLLEKGIIWRWRRKEGLNYDDHLAEFEADLANEIKADRGIV